MSLIKGLTGDDIDSIIGRPKKNVTKENLENCHLLSIVTQVVSDLSLTNNRINFSYDISDDADKSYIKVNYKRFERILLNLYKNSVEAILDEGTISTRIYSDNDFVTLEIEDNGKGMPKHVLEKLGQKGISYGKEAGTGLGVYDAFEQFNKWNIGIKYETTEASGTVVKLKFELVEENPLFPTEILIPEKSTVIVLDDDPSVHESWKQRFKTLRDDSVTYKYFDHPDMAKKELRSLLDNNKEFLFLGDYDLRNDKTDGVRFIKENNLMEYSILVTSSIDSVLDDCRQYKIPVISKSIQSSIDIHTIS